MVNPFKFLKRDIMHTICCVHYYMNGNLYKHLFTRLSNLTPSKSDCTSTDSEIEAYNLFTDEYQILNESQIDLYTFNFFEKQGHSYEYMIGDVSSLDVSDHLSKNLQIISTFKDNINTRIEIEKQNTDQMCDPDLKIYASLIYNIDTSTDNREVIMGNIINQCRKDYLIDRQFFKDTKVLLRRVLRLDNLTDANLDAVKLRWIELIGMYMNHALTVLNEEEVKAVSENDADSIDEIKIIKQMLSDIPSKASDEFKQFNSLHQIISYWPGLLLPAPIFVE